MRTPLISVAAVLGMAGVAVVGHTSSAFGEVAAPALAAAPSEVPVVTIEMVPVGDPGNAADPTTGYGAVASNYSIGKYEVTVAQYVAFLNAVATVPTNEAIQSLYKEEMADPKSKEDPGALIQRTGSGVESDPYVYTAIPSSFWPDGAQRPVPWVTWFDAARFANWMHNGANAGASTETGAYTLTNFQQSDYVARNADARFWIPSEDEWYKAAYYDPSRPGESKYWDFPTSSDKPPRIAEVAAAAPAPAANFQNVYKGSDGGVLAPVGSYPDSTSHYGTLDQGGQLWEWTEAAYPYADRGPNRIVRGGSWGPGITPLRKTVRRDYGPMSSDSFYFDDDTGFRLAGSGGS